MIKNYMIFIVIIAAISLLIFFQKQKSELSSQKIILLGVDGAEWNVINPLIEQNKLNQFSKLLKESSYGNLFSPNYICSAVVWTDIATGKIPEKHGIHDWKKTEESGAIFGRKIDLVTSNDVKSIRLWEILIKHNKTVGIYHWLVTWPPDIVKGFLISGSLSQDENITYPPDLKKILIERNMIRDDLDDLFSENIFWLLSKYDIDFLAVYFSKTDYLQHFFWKYWEPEKFNLTNETEIEENRNIIVQAYEDTDNFLEKINKRFSDKITIFLVSDHGFQAQEKMYYILPLNPLLEELELFNSSNDLQYLVSDVGSEAYQCGAFELISNNLGSENICFLESANKNRIIRMLNGIKYVKTNENLFIDIKLIDNKTKLELIYQIEPLISNLNNNSILVRFNDRQFQLYVPDPISGIHKPEGIIIVNGPAIKENYYIKNATVYDVAPTILYLYGLSIPTDMDGRVLTEIIKEDYLKEHPIQFSEESSQKGEMSETIKINETMRAGIEERLRELGYILK